MKENRYSLFVICSVLLHLLFAFVMVLVPISDFFKHQSIKAMSESTPMVLQFEEPPPELQEKPQEKQKPVFIPTEEFQKTEQANPNAILESERNTSLRGQEKGADNKSPLPQQSGDSRAALSYVDQPRSEYSPGQNRPAAQSQKQQPQKQQPQQPSNPVPEQKQNDPLNNSQEGVPVLPKKTEPPRPQTTPSPRPTQEQQQQQQSPPPSSYVFQRQRSALSGSTPKEQGVTSPESKESDMGRYKSKMYRAIGSRWYLSVDKHGSLLAIGAVKVKFFVQANGVIRDVQVMDQSGRIDILERISMKAVIDSGPFEPFPDSMKQQIGTGYWEDITFTIY